MTKQKVFPLTVSALSTVSILFLTGFTDLHCITVGGLPEIIPSLRADVCRVGDTLEVTCNITNSTASVLQWSLNFATEIRMTPRLSSLISSTNRNARTETLDSMTFTFSRSSELNELPLASTLVIRLIQNSLNGTWISCTEGIGGNTETSANTTVFIVGNNLDYYHPSTPAVEYSEAYFTMDTVTVSLWWTNLHEHSLVTYHINIIPRSKITMNSSNTKANVTLSYNTQYVVSVVANFCYQSNATTIIMLNYGKCTTPLDQESSNSSLVLAGLTKPALEGTSVNFTCNPGFELSGPTTATCMSYGNWIPDIGNVTCIESDVTTPKECNNNFTNNGQCCSKNCANDNSRDISVNFGSITGVAAAITTLLIMITVIAASIILMLWRKGLLHKVKGKRADSADQGNRSIPNTQPQVTVSSAHLVYADIGPSLFKQTLIPIQLELDDSHVEYSQIKHNTDVQQSQVIINKEPESNGDLTTINLDNLLIQLRPEVSLKWYEFGIAVGISSDVLDSYAKSCSPEDCIMEMLDYWLRNEKSKPTWKDIADILKAIGLQKLACDIEMVYSTGQLPIQIDTNGFPQNQEFQSIANSVQDVFESVLEKPPPLPPKMKKELNYVDDWTSQKFHISPKVPARPPKPL